MIVVGIAVFGLEKGVVPVVVFGVVVGVARATVHLNRVAVVDLQQVVRAKK